MEKEILFLDYDEVIGDTTKAICTFYNNKYKNHPDFKEAKHELIFDWGFKVQCPLFTAEERKNIWGDKEFFKGMLPMEGAEKYIKLLSEDYNIVVTTICNTENIIRKIEWFDIYKNISDYISQFIYLSHKGLEMNKSSINMFGGTFIDDSTSNLVSSNASKRFIFGRKTGWNNDAENLGFKRLWDWEQVYNRLKGKQ